LAAGLPLTVTVININCVPKTDVISVPKIVFSDDEDKILIQNLYL